MKFFIISVLKSWFLKLKWF